MVFSLSACTDSYPDAVTDPVTDALTVHPSNATAQRSAAGGADGMVTTTSRVT